MEVFRIAKTKYIRDLTGSGPRTYGGRWNHKGVGLVYTSESRSLAAIEFLVHVPVSIAPKDISIITIEIPKKISRKNIDLKDLPKNWRENLPPEEIARMGSDWANSKESLLLRVPSAIIQNEYNILINPMHPDIGLLKLSKPERFSFDLRLFRN